MGYMRGDYYGRGDYYAGDPGIFSFLGGVAKGIVKGVATVGSFLPGPIGTISRIISGTGDNPASTPATKELTRGEMVTAATAPLPMLPATMGGGGGRAMTTFGGLPADVAVPRGRRSHPNKSTYVIRGGGTSRWGAGGQLQVIPKGTVPVPNRRMNVANPRALRRSLRRVAGFAKLTKRVRRAVSMAASAVGVHHRRGKTTIRRK